MTTTDPTAPTQPAPPPGFYPNPDGPGQRFWDGEQWSPPAPPAPASGPQGSRRALFIVIASVGAVAALLAAGFFLILQPKNDAKEILRDTRPGVERSLAISRRAQRDVTRFMRGGDPAVRRRAIREIDQTISLRQRAIARLRTMEDNSFPGDSNYRRGAKVWAGTLRGSVKALRSLRGAVPSKPSIGYLERRGEAAIVVTEILYLRRYERLLERMDRNVISDLV